MISRIRHTSYVINFLDVDFDSNQVSNLLEPETDLLLSRVIVEGIEDWEIEFKATYGEGSKLRIAKRTKSDTKYKQKLIVIHIPIPTKDLVSWGVTPEQHIGLKEPPDAEKYIVKLDIEPAKFSNRFDYIIAAMRQGILFSLQDGFTVNGKKVKL